ncbi:MAG: hypothetical protein EOO77_35575 [Oxalobacteraceae bacterium]|nr:MAG: hypothetical protein EOO77_35575 [Oxalobacteraceae bacterium]
MRSWINCVEALSVHPRPYRSGETYNLHHAPTVDEFMEVLQASDYVVRALIADDGELWVWNADHALHSDVDKVANTQGTLAFTIFHDHIDPQQSSKRELRAALRKNATMAALKISRMRFS